MLEIMSKTPQNIKHLSPEMKRFYKKIMENFDLEDHHVVLLTRACESLDLAEQARVLVAAEGLTTRDRYGTAKIHPCVKAQLDAKNSARLLLRELGLDLEPPGETGRPPRQY